ncbi:acylphosphatase [Candidatus Woesearchaeota archaeon]|nr:acylphosphatase [Candidatus Woesearchaeota archaeon]
MKRANIQVYGFVQGVFFRSNTKKIALDLGLKGYARNMPDGSVEIIVEGPKEKIGKLIEFCKKSPGASQVSKVKVKFEKPKNEFDGFEVRH